MPHLDAQLDAEKELRKRIAQARRKKDGSVLFVLGTGVAKAASGLAGAADWAGLLELGLSKCDALKAQGALKSPETWDGVELRRRLESKWKSAADLIAVASAVENALRESRGYEVFLRDTVGALPLKSREIFDALTELELPVATCNYDGLIEKALRRPAITWRDHGMVLRFLRGQQDGVLHLHGHYNEPESVVLGIESYNKIVGSEHAQAVQRLLFLDRTLIFVGFGAGLSDPNFGALLRWATTVLVGTDCFHVRLCRDGEVGDLMGDFPITQRIHVLGFGPDHKDLAPYLRSLIQKRVPRAPNDRSGRGGSVSKPPSPGPSGSTPGARPSEVTRGTEPQRHKLKELLLRVMPTPSDLQVFCQKNFAGVLTDSSESMAHAQRIDLLLDHIEHGKIVSTLAEVNPERFGRYKHLLT